MVTTEGPQIPRIEMLERLIGAISRRSEPLTTLSEAAEHARNSLAVSRWAGTPRGPGADPVGLGLALGIDPTRFRAPTPTGRR